MGLFLIFLAVFMSSCPAQVTHKLDELLPGVQSPYSSWIVDLIHSWPPTRAAVSDSTKNPVSIECIATPDQPLYIGLGQWMTIHAPMETVEAVLDDFGHYKDLFPDFADVHIISRDGNLLDVFWEQKIPVFFIPNITYETLYLIDRSHPNRRVYRYQLRKAGQIQANDGVIVLERLNNQTRYTEFDFNKSDWGIIKTLAHNQIWTNIANGLYLSDITILLKSEHPDWSYQTIIQESHKILDQFPVEAALKHCKQPTEYLRLK